MDRKLGVKHRLPALALLVVITLLVFGLATVTAIQPDQQPAAVVQQGKARDSVRAEALARSTQEEAGQPAAGGAQMAGLRLDPSALQPRFQAAILDVIQPDPLVGGLIAQVATDTLQQYEPWLTGEEPVEIGGEPYTLTTRYTFSGEPVQRATQFAYEHLESLGLDTEYHYWSGAAPPNVLATRWGLRNPEDVYILCAHLDDMPSGPLAPGADDNASGSTGVLVAADILSQYASGPTLKFILWTGEEQGMSGSNAWAEWASAQGLKIQGVLNLDMIAYDSDAYPIVDLHARSWLTGSVTLAQLFAQVVHAYDIDLVPDVVIDNPLSNRSDNKSFWDEGYAAILAIEDFHDTTPFYHTTNDRLATLNMAYFTEFVRASVATFAHLSGCLVSETTGHLHGYVKVGSAPVADATVSVQNCIGETFVTSTDSSGYYAHTLPAGTYTVTASAAGYYPVDATGIAILPAATTAQDLNLAMTPMAVIAPPSLEARLYADERVTQTLWLTNAGRADLIFSVHAGDIPWLSATPTGGWLPPQEGLSLTVTLDAAGLDPGSYGGLLDLESNDPLTPHTSVPVSLTVAPPCVPVWAAGFAWEPPVPLAGETITFAGVATGSLPITFTWDLDDGTWAIGQAVTHGYPKAKTYTVTMTATNCSTSMEVATHAVSVAPWRLRLPLILRVR